MSEETLKAISARVQQADEMLNVGNVVGAREVLTGLRKILPDPEDRNIVARKMVASSVKEEGKN